MIDLKRALLCVALLLTAVLLLRGSGPVSAAATGSQPEGQIVPVLETHDTLQPERASVFAREVQRAEQEGAPAMIVDLSTPGGLPESADAMIATMRQSTVPIIVWSGISQTRVTGDGLRLMAEADIALMSPGTFLTPLWTERLRSVSPETRTIESQRLLQNLADTTQRHGRRATALEELSSGTHWFSADEALQAGFIDGIASRREDVLRFATGRVVRRGDRDITLNLRGASATTVKPEPQELLMLALMNPDLTVLLLTLGLLLIYLEINTPGTVIPGTAGILLVLLAVYALHLLPLNWIGILMCLIAALLLLLEARFASHGVLAAAGIVLFVIGLAVLVRGPIPQLQVAWQTAVGAGVGFGGVTATLVVLGMEARRAKVKTGSEAMLGWLAVAQTPLSPEGHILVRGELWRARLTTNDSFVAAGDRVKVLRADGLTLEVTAIPLSNTA